MTLPLMNGLRQPLYNRRTPRVYDVPRLRLVTYLATGDRLCHSQDPQGRYNIWLEAGFNASLGLQCPETMKLEQEQASRQAFEAGFKGLKTWKLE